MTHVALIENDTIVQVKRNAALIDVASRPGEWILLPEGNHAPFDTLSVDRLTVTPAVAIPLSASAQERIDLTRTNNIILFMKTMIVALRAIEDGPHNLFSAQTLADLSTLEDLLE